MRQKDDTMARFFTTSWHVGGDFDMPLAELNEEVDGNEGEDQFQWW